MRRLVSILLLMISILNADAQKNVIELTVSDTMLIQADHFQFRVNVSLEYDMTTDTVGMRTDPDYIRKRAERQRQRLIDHTQKIESNLKENGFFTEPITLSELNFRSSNISSFNISTNSIKAIQYLIKLTTTEKGISFNLINLSAKDEEEHYKKLFKKLLAKAKERAAYIAGLQQKKVTGILSLGEKRFENPYGFNSLTLLAGMPMRKDNIAAVDGILNLFPIINTIQIKFSIQ